MYSLFVMKNYLVIIRNLMYSYNRHNIYICVDFILTIQWSLISLSLNYRHCDIFAGLASHFRRFRQPTEWLKQPPTPPSTLYRHSVWGWSCVKWHRVWGVSCVNPFEVCHVSIWQMCVMYHSVCGVSCITLSEVCHASLHLRCVSVTLSEVCEKKSSLT